MIHTTAWRAGVATDAGMRRANNEDRVFVNEDAGIFLVVDGMGGQAGGEQAAETAVHAVVESLSSLTSDPADRVRQSITAANNAIYALAQDNEQWQGMACVMTLAVASEDRVVIGHVGDSRLYLIWDGKLRKLTSDHSPVGEQEDIGEISEQDAMKHPLRNHVFRDVGSRPRTGDEGDFIEVRSFRFHPEAAFLLCSDGLSDALLSSEISAIVETYDGDPEAVSKRLVEAANSAGGKDNISVIFIAGSEFTGAGSGAAPRRQAITRARIDPRRRAPSSAGWLFAGVLIGAALWAVLTGASLDRISFSTERRIVAAGADPHAIATALSAAQPGDTIEIPPGEYLGPIELRDEISLVSRKPGAAVIRVDPDAVMDAGIAFAARHTRRGRLTGFRVVGSEDAPLATGILLDGANFEIDDVEISGAGDCAIRASAGAAPAIRSSNLHDNGGCGVWIGSGSSLRLVGNRISRNGNILAALRAGIEIHPPVAAVIEGNIITSNGRPNLEDDIRRANVVDPPTREIK